MDGVGFGSAQGKVSIPRIPVHKYNGAKRRNPKYIDHAMIIHKDISSKKTV
jgi:hypothetical protein